MSKDFPSRCNENSNCGQPYKTESNDQLLLKKLRNNDKTLCSSLSYNIITNVGLFSLTDVLGGLSLVLYMV